MDLNQTFSEKFVPLAISTPVRRESMRKPARRNWRTSSPLPAARLRRRLDLDAKYESWKKNLHFPSSDFKVRGMRNPPANFISGNAVSANPQMVAVAVRKEDLEVPAVRKEDLEVPVMRKEDLEVTTPEEYMKKMDARNKSICDRIFPMLRKGLQKMSLKKEPAKDLQKSAQDCIYKRNTNSFQILNYFNRR